MHYYASDEKKKGASSALVFLDRFIGKQKPIHSDKYGSEVETVIMFGDRGGGDQWNAMFNGHLPDITTKHKVQWLSGTSAAGMF